MAQHAGDVAAVSGDVSWKNDVLGLSMLSFGGQGSGDLTALLSSGSGRVWVQNGKARFEIQGATGDTIIVGDSTSVWVYTYASNTATEYTLPAGSKANAGRGQREQSGTTQSSPDSRVADPVAAIDEFIQKLAPDATLAVSDPVTVAGQSCYVLSLIPKAANTVFGSVQVAIDSKTYLPLKLDVYAKGTVKPVFTVGFTSVSYSTLADSIFAFTPPANATVAHKTLTLPAAMAGGSGTGSDVGPDGAADQSSSTGEQAPLTLAEAAAKAGFTPLAAQTTDPALAFGGASVIPAQQVDLQSLLGQLQSGALGSGMLGSGAPARRRRPVLRDTAGVIVTSLQSLPVRRCRRGPVDRRSHGHPALRSRLRDGGARRGQGPHRARRATRADAGRRPAPQPDRPRAESPSTSSTRRWVPSPSGTKTDCCSSPRAASRRPISRGSSPVSAERFDTTLDERLPRGCDGRPVVLSTHGLTKDFKRLRAVDSLDLSVCRGDVFGFLGPNGCGKTTTIRMIFGLTYPTSGYVQVLDHKVPDDRLKALRHLGGFVDDPMFYGNMTARRNLRLLGGMNGEVSEERISEVLEMVGLSRAGRSKVGSYSHGMRQRLGIALALIHKPDVIVLDEPTSGLDPQGMKDVRELIRDLGKQGTTVFLSSHLLHEIELVCNRAAIMSRGRVIVQGPVSELHPASHAVKVLTGNQSRAWEIIRGMAAPGTVRQDEDYIMVESGDGFVPEMVRRLVAGNIDILAVVPAIEQGLEDMFLELTAEAETDRGAGAPPAGAGGEPK